MKLKFLIAIIFILTSFFGFSSLISQTDIDNEFPEDEEIDWIYLNFDISYGSSGPGGALGFRYSYFGFGISATGFASDIPRTSPQQSSNQNDLQEKKYPGNTVCGDFYGYYDLDEFSLFANIGFYSSVDSILLWDSKEKLYYRHGTEITSGICWGFGAQMPLTFLNEDNVYLDQLIGGVGYHSRLGVILRIAYRW